MTTAQPTASPDKTAENTMTIAQKRQAIAWALTPYLSHDNLESALSIWEHKYAHQPTFALQRFLSEFCTTATLAAQRSQILQSLIKALSHADGKPIRQFEEAKAAPQAPASSLPAVSVFSRLVETLLGLLPQDQAIKTRLYLLENLAKLRLPLMTQRDLQAWLSQQYPIPASTRVDEEVLRHLVNLAYVVLCEYQGPVKADQLLHEAVVSTEQATRGQAYSVRQLL